MMSLGTPTRLSSSSSPDAVNIAQVGGSPISLGQTTMSQSLPVVIASNQTPVTVNQGTSPWVISGSVTANAGTNLNTSLLALESGGNLAILAGGVSASVYQTNLAKVGGVVFSLGQQLAAASLPVVLTASQLTTLTPLTSVTVTQATGTNLHTVTDSGSVTNATLQTQTDTIMIGGVNIKEFGGSSVTIGQQLAAASIPVILPAATITTLTPPTAAGTPSPDVSSTGALGSLNATANLTLAGYNSASFVISGTWSGTISFFVSSDGSTFVASHAFSVTNMGAQPQTTVNDTFIPFFNAGMKTIQCKMTSYTSGTATITWRQSQTINYETVFEGMQGMPIPAMGDMIMGSDGTNARNISTDTLGRLILAPNGSTLSANTGATAPTLSYQSALTNTATAIKATAGNLYGWHIYNPNNAVTYIQIFNKTTANVTLGTTTPDWVVVVPQQGWLDTLVSTVPIWGFSTAMTIAATTSASNAVAPTNTLLADIFYI